MPDIILWPFGPVDVQTKDYAATIAATIVNNKTEVTLAQLGGAATLNLTLSDKITKGADLTIRVSVDGTNRVLTSGTKMTGLAQTLLSSKSYLLKYEYDGTNFVHVGTTLLN